MVKIFQIFLPIIFLVVSSAQGFVETELYAGSCSGSLKVLKGGKTIDSHKKSQKIKIRGGYPKHLQVVAEGCGCWRVYVGFRFNGASTEVCSGSPKKVSHKIRSICHNNNCHKGFRHVNAGSSWVTLLVVGVVMVSALAVIGYKRLRNRSRHQEIASQEDQEMVEVNVNNDQWLLINWLRTSFVWYQDN